MPHFVIHPRLRADCHLLGRLQLCRVLLKRNATLPWFVLVPETDAAEPHLLGREQRALLVEESDALARFVARNFDSDRINSATIGNLVPQLHCHVVGRRQDDPCWPGVVWGNLPPGPAWTAGQLESIGRQLQSEIGMARTLCDPAQRPLPWRAVGDVVMGGHSHSRMEPATEITALFGGHVSLIDGGFASVRCDLDPAEDHSAAGAIALRVRGDGKRYRLSLRCDAAGDGVVYQAPFEPRDAEWQEVVLRFEDFRPSRHGRPVAGASPLNPATLHSIGLLIADRQEGAFALEIAAIDSVFRPE